MTMAVRYAFQNQPDIGFFNLRCLARALSPLVPDEAIKAGLEAYEAAFAESYGGLPIRMSSARPAASSRPLTSRTRRFGIGSWIGLRLSRPHGHPAGLGAERLHRDRAPAPAPRRSVRRPPRHGSLCRAAPGLGEAPHRELLLGIRLHGQAGILGPGGLSSGLRAAPEVRQALRTAAVELVELIADGVLLIEVLVVAFGRVELAR